MNCPKPDPGVQVLLSCRKELFGKKTSRGAQPHPRCEAGRDWSCSGEHWAVWDCPGLQVGTAGLCESSPQGVLQEKRAVGAKK